MKFFSIVLMISGILFTTVDVDAQVLRQGSTGQPVVEVQNLLIVRGYLYQQSDGVYGQGTAQAVRRFQTEYGLESTGEVDDKTLDILVDGGQKVKPAKLIKTKKQIKEAKPEKRKSEIIYKRGDKSTEIANLQERLSIHGYSTNGADGIYGKGTEEAVRRFQEDKKIAVTGEINKITEQKILELALKPDKYKRKFIVETTAYSMYDPGSGKYTCRGHLLRRGYIAVDPNVIPLGTQVFIEGYGYAIADDTGGVIKGNIVDLAMDSHEEAIQYGRRNAVIYILN